MIIQLFCTVRQDCVWGQNAGWKYNIWSYQRIKFQYFWDFPQVQLLSHTARTHRPIGFRWVTSINLNQLLLHSQPIFLPKSYCSRQCHVFTLMGNSFIKSTYSERGHPYDMTSCAMTRLVVKLIQVLKYIYSCHLYPFKVLSVSYTAIF
jgi:hypothetical protein